MEDSIGVKESPLEKSPRKSDNVGILKVPNFLEVLECAVLRLGILYILVSRSAKESSEKKALRKTGNIRILEVRSGLEIMSYSRFPLPIFSFLV